MNLRELHLVKKEVSAKELFKGEVGSTHAIQLLKNAELKEHITKTPALLICVSGFVLYKDENKNVVELKSGDYYQIPPDVVHKLEAVDVSQLILLK